MGKQIQSFKQSVWTSVIVVILIVFISSCAQPVESDQSDSISVQPAIVDKTEPSEPAEPPEPEFPFYYPLTGIGTEEEVDRRPFVVFVENSPRARPQSGLQAADIVYEILAEGEITRFVAVFQSEESETIGPVRSARPYLVRIGADLDGVIVHAGWSQEAKNILVTERLSHFDAVYGDHDFFWRSSERKAPHNLYTSTEKLREGVEARKYRFEEWQDPGIHFIHGTKLYEPKTIAASQNLENNNSGQNSSATDSSISSNNNQSTTAGPGNSRSAKWVEIPYIAGYHVAYKWDEQAGHYIRYMLGEVHKDKETEQALIAHNLLILKAEHRIIDDVGRRHVDVIGPGSGYLVQNGSFYEVVWKRENGMIRLYDGDEQLAWIPGKTWIQFVPSNAEIHFTDSQPTADE